MRNLKSSNRAGAGTGFFMESRSKGKVPYLVSVFILQIVLLACLQSSASSLTPAYSSLQRSRDALLDQRRYLQSEADRLAAKIADLQRQQDTVNSYLRDNDRALRDVESAMQR